MERTVKLPLRHRAKYFGYVIWEKPQDEGMKAVLSGLKRVHLYFRGNDLGEKNIDWRYRRISIGYKWTRRLVGESSQFILRREHPDILKVECR